MLHGSIYYGLLILLAIALLFAAGTDWKRRQIDNWLNLAITLAAPLFWWAGGLALWPDVALHIGVAAVAFGIAAALFAIGQMGGGDVKLISALALWFPPPLFLHMLMIMAVLGYILTMGLGAVRVGRSQDPARRGDIVVLIALSFIAALLIAGFAGLIPLPLPPFVRNAAGSSVVAAVAILQLPVLVLAVVSLSAIRIFRRRQVRMEAPYGIAISGAGLWLIGGLLAAATPLGSGLA